MKHKVSKNLFIGLGGTGSSTLIQVKKAVMQKYGQIPPVIDFLIIDTDASVDNESYNLDSSVEHFSPNEILHVPIERPDLIKNTKRIKNWLSDEVEPKIIASSKGAKQVRSLGRFAFFQHYPIIEKKIKDKINEINSIAHVQNPDFESSEETLIHMVFSPCGGTGAGTFLDTAINIKSANPNQTIYAWMVLPEYYKVYPRTQNVGKNAYASLIEIDHLMGKDHNDKNPWSNYGKNPYVVSYDKGKELNTDHFDLFDRIHLFDKKMIDGHSTIMDIDDLKDRIARTLLLHVTDAGDTLFSTYNNDESAEEASGPLANYKRRNYQSTGYSEIILDREYLTNYRKNYAYRILIKLLSQSDSVDSHNLCKEFIDNNNLREDNGHDDVIDRLYPMNEIRYSNEAVLPGDFDENANISIKENCSIQLNNLITNITNRCTSEKEKLKGEFSTKLKAEIKSLYQNNGALVLEKSFLNCLVGSFSAMRSEMADEQQAHQNSAQKIEKELINYEENIIAAGDTYFGRTKRVRSECELYAEKYKSRIVLEAELIRKKMAEEFYTHAITQIETLQSKRDSFSRLIGDLDRTTNAELQKLDSEIIGDKGKEFEIYIHNYCSDLLSSIDKFSPKEALNSIDFNQLKDSSTIEEIRQQLNTYLNQSEYLTEIDSLNLEALIAGLTKEQKKDIMKNLNDLAKAAINLDRTFLHESGLTVLEPLGVLIVENKEETIFQRDSEYSTYWGNKPDDVIIGESCEVASSYDRDRIKFLKIMGSFPATAIVGIDKLKHEFETAKGYHFCDLYFEGAMDLIDGAPDEEVSESFALAAALDIVKLDRGALKFFDPSGGKPTQIVPGSKGKNDRFLAFKQYTENKKWSIITNDVYDKVYKEEGKPQIESILRAHFDRLLTADYLGKKMESIEPDSDEEKQIWAERKTIKKLAEAFPIAGASEW